MDAFGRDTEISITAGLEEPEHICYPVGPKVCIIGAGVGGLQMARALQKRGIPFRLFEAAARIGGVWRMPLHEQGAQVPWEFYELPEMPYPEHIREQYKHRQTPPAAAIQEYLQIYVGTFGLEEHFCFNSRVTALDRPEGKDEGWVVTITGPGGFVSSEEFDYVALATGAFNSPYIPDIKNKELYCGEDILARELTTANLDIAKGKRVIVIGSAKTALDAAGASAEVADSVTMLSRKAHYHTPFTIQGLFSFVYVVYTRVGIWLAHHPYPFAKPRGWLARAVHAAAYPLRVANWAMASRGMPRQHKLPKEMHPEQSAYTDSYGEVSSLVDDALFLKHIHAGKIIVVQGEAEAFTEDGIRLKDGRSVQGDLIVYATGFQRSYQMLGRELPRIHPCEEGYPLYRDIIPPDVKSLAFLGEAYSLNACCSTGLAGEWVAALLQGEVQLPTRAEQWADVNRKRAWRRSFMPKNNFRDGRLCNFQINWYDELLGDMGFPAQRKGSRFKDFWQPYTSADYADVFKAPTLKAARDANKGKDAAKRVTVNANGTLDVAGLN